MKKRFAFLKLGLTALRQTVETLLVEGVVNNLSLSMLVTEKKIWFNDLYDKWESNEKYICGRFGILELINRVTKSSYAKDVTLRVTNSNSKNKKFHFELLTPSQKIKSYTSNY